MVLHYLYPTIIFVYFAVSSLVAIFTLQDTSASKRKNAQQPSRLATLGLLGLFISAYIAQLIIILAISATGKDWQVQDHIVVGRLSCVHIFGLQLSQLYDNPRPLWYPYGGSWALALGFEALMGATEWFKAPHSPAVDFPIVNLCLALLRCALLVVLLGLFCFRCGRRQDPDSDEETQTLLNKSDAAQNGRPRDGAPNGQSPYGSTEQSDDSSNDQNELPWERRERMAREAMEKRLEAGGNWLAYAKSYMVCHQIQPAFPAMFPYLGPLHYPRHVSNDPQIFFPYIWPVGLPGLQARAVAVVVCLFVSNLLNLLIPRQTGVIMDSLSGVGSADPWISVITYLVLRLASSESGIDLLRQWLWLPVRYYSNEAITRAAFSHIMYLSADFHDSKSTSDMIMAIHGGTSVSSIVENLLLHAAPMLLDLGVAVVYLSVTFGSFEGLTTVATGTIFLLLASRLVAQSSIASRSRVQAYFKEHYIRTSAFLGWTTASAFNQLGYEDNRHANAVTNRWSREKEYIMGWNFSVALQSVVLTFGLAASAMFAVYRIRSGQATPGQFAMLLMYWAQLCAPLNFFARLGKSISNDLVEAEQLLMIMQTQPSVQNKKRARPLKFVAGEIEFDDVCFSYDGQKEVINHISLRVSPGTTVAFVGSTGAGKSTLLRLVDRFYDVTGGSIRFDGQDLRDVDLFR